MPRYFHFSHSFSPTLHNGLCCLFPWKRQNIWNWALKNITHVLQLVHRHAASLNWRIGRYPDSVKKHIFGTENLSIARVPFRFWRCQRGLEVSRIYDLKRNRFFWLLLLQRGPDFEALSSVSCHASTDCHRLGAVAALDLGQISVQTSGKWNTHPRSSHQASNPDFCQAARAWQVRLRMSEALYGPAE